MLPSRRELDSRKRIDSATELDFLTQNASKRRPKAPQDAPRASQELPESSPGAPQELPESSGKRPRSPPERSKRTLGRPGGLSGCFRRPRGLILEPPRPIFNDLFMHFAVSRCPFFLREVCHKTLKSSICKTTVPKPGAAVTRRMASSINQGCAQGLSPTCFSPRVRARPAGGMDLLSCVGHVKSWCLFGN